MNIMQRIYLWIGTLFWSVLLFWFFGSLLFFALALLGLVYVVIGGKLHA